jgi:hypothetical protein
MRNLLIALAFIAALASTSAHAAFDWSPCAAEIEKFAKGEKDDEKIWAALQKHDIDLSEKCDNEGHSKYEAATGKKK